MQSVHFSLFFLRSFLRRVHVNYYFTSTIYKKTVERLSATPPTTTATTQRKKVTRIVQSIVSCLSAHCSERCCCIFNVFRELRYEHTDRHSRAERELKLQAASCRNLFRWTCEIAKWSGLKWDEVTFEVKILIYGQFQNSGLPYIFPSSSSFRAAILLPMMMTTIIILFVYIFWKWEKRKRERWQWTRIWNGNGLCHTELLVVALPNHRIHRRRRRCCLR